MPKYLIEVPHDAEIMGCARVVQVFLETGSHFLAQAEWGCMDGVHSAYLMIECESKDEARSVVPPAMRADAKITALNKFTLEQVHELLSQHVQ